MNILLVIVVILIAFLIATSEWLREHFISKMAFTINPDETLTLKGKFVQFAVMIGCYAGINFVIG